MGFRGTMIAGSKTQAGKTRTDKPPSSRTMRRAKEAHQAKRLSQQIKAGIVVKDAPDKIAP